jgi:hypothetical protein
MPEPYRVAMMYRVRCFDELCMVQCRLCYFVISPHDPQGPYLGRFLKVYSGTLMGNFTVHSTVPVLRGFYTGRHCIEDVIQ